VSHEKARAIEVAGLFRAFLSLEFLDVELLGVEDSLAVQVLELGVSDVEKGLRDSVKKNPKEDARDCEGDREWKLLLHDKNEGGDDDQKDVNDGAAECNIARRPVGGVRAKRVSEEEERGCFLF